MSFDVPQKDTQLRVDKRYVEVCEESTMKVVSACPSEPVVVGAKYEDGYVKLKFAEQRPDANLEVTLRLSAIRRGFMNDRFTPRSHNQFVANEKFLNSAYPSE